MAPCWLAPRPATTRGASGGRKGWKWQVGSVLNEAADKLLKSAGAALRARLIEAEGWDV